MRKIPLLFTLFIYLISQTIEVKSQVLINEYSASNLSYTMDDYGGFEDWIELYNAGESTIDLGGYYLSDRPDENLKWQFPEGSFINAQSFLRVWTTGRNVVNGTHYHTNFKLTQTKDNPESIVLSNPAGEILSEVQLNITQKDHSRGRTTDGSSSWSIFTSPTANSSNNSSTPFQAYTDKPVVSDTAGFYENPLQITFTTTEPDSEIRYTLDGSEPTLSSQLYSGPISVNATTIVIARTFSSNPNMLPGLLEFNTYFINKSHTMGVMSVSAAELDDLLNGNASLRPFGTFEYFNEEGIRTTYGYGEFNEHGQDSWVHDQRSIDYISRDECGYNYAIREQLISLTDRDEFQRIILRAAGDDNYPGIDSSAHLRDYFVQNTSERNGMHLDVRKGQKGLLYVNGAYWGVYGYREKVSDHDFTDYYYDQGKYEIYYLKLWGGSWAQYGGQAAWDDWNDLHNFIKFNDMSDPDNYEYVKTRLDYKSLVDYVLINSYVVCSDWINWNVGWWRGTNPEGDHQKWGYVLWDEDATFAHYINYTGVPGISPTTSPCYPEGLTSDPEEHIVMLNHLLDNPEFKNYYVNRYIDLYNTAFHPESMIPYLNSIEEQMAPEMPDHIARWGGSMTQWQNNVQKIRDFVSSRHNYLPSGLSACYNLSGPFELNVAVDPPQSGLIRINSIIPDEPYFGGYYFGGIETHLEAIEANANFEFDHWELYNNELTPSIYSPQVSLELTSGDYVTAKFLQVELTDSLIINEINYNDDGVFNVQDWIEFYNPHDTPTDITGWIFKDSDDNHSFVFPESTIIDPFGYLVLTRDTTEFTNLFPGVENIIGNMDFGFNSNGELLRLFDSTGVLIDTVHYSSEAPWPTEPNGEGPTLELKYWEYDNALPESWAASEDHGTPGEMNGYVVRAEENIHEQEKITFTIYPNPLTDKGILQVTSQKKLLNARLIIYNAFGETVSKYYPIKGERFIFFKNGLSPGIYICRLFDHNNRIIGNKKLIVE